MRGALKLRHKKAPLQKSSFNLQKQAQVNKYSYVFLTGKIKPLKQEGDFET